MGKLDGKGVTATKVTDESLGLCPKVQIQQILLSNPVWVRRHDDDLGRLRDSIAESGMISPILLDPGFLVVDGGRRVKAAKELGWEYVPVLVTAEWSVVRDYFIECRRLEKNGWPHEPLSWLEINDLHRRVLANLYRNRRGLLSGRKMKAEVPASSSLSNYARDLREMLGFTNKADGYINVIRDLGACLKQAYQVSNALGDKVTEMIDRAEKAGRGLHSVQAAARKAVRDAQVGRHPTDLKEAQKQAELIDRMIKLIYQVGAEAGSLKEINDAMPADVAARLRGEMRTAVRLLYPLRKLLEQYADEAEERERDLDGEQ